MARTFIGELILRLNDEMSGKAKSAANNHDTSISRIRRAAQQLNRTTWGRQFEERLRKVWASPTESDRLRAARDKLNSSIACKNLRKAIAATEWSNFKMAATPELSALAAAAKDADTGPRGNTLGLDQYFGRDTVDSTPSQSINQAARPEIDMSASDAALQKAGAIGGYIVTVLSVATRPMVDIAGLGAAIQKVGQLVGLLSHIGPLLEQVSQQSSASVFRRMNCNFSDHGVLP